MTTLAALIRCQGALLQAVSIAPDRATRLAEEVQALNEAMLKASQVLAPEDEPSTFFAMLAQRGQGP